MITWRNLETWQAAMKGRRGLTVALAAVALAGCGGGDASVSTDKTPAPPRELKPVSISLNGYEGPEHGGILMAQAYGYFAEAGLEVSPGSPGLPTFQMRQVLGEVSDIGISHLPQVVISRAKGKPIVAVGSLISQPTAAMIWLERSGIDEIADLKGKTIAIPGVPYQKDLLENVLARSGLKLADVRVKAVAYKSVPELASGGADAAFGGSANVEGAELEALGLDPVVAPVRDLGVPPYDELVVFVRRDRLKREPGMVRGLLEAMYRGTSLAVENPLRTIEVLQNGLEPSPDSTPEGMKLGVEATLPLLSRSGYMDPGQAKRLIDWMHSEGMIKKKIPVSSLLTNEYLPRSER